PRAGSRGNPGRSDSVKLCEYDRRPTNEKGERMKKTLLFVLAAALVAGTAPAAMASTPALTTRAEDISFDGYCDGLHLNFPSQGLPGTPFTVDGYQTGCGSGGVFGVAKPSHRGSYGVDRGVEFLTAPE